MSKNNGKVTRLNSDYMQHYGAYVERRQKKHQRLMRRLMILGVISLVIFGSLTLFHIKQRMVRAEKIEEQVQLKEKMSQLEEQEKEYEEEINLLNDDSYILDIARTNYFYSKEGELIFKMPDESPSY